MEVSDEPEKKRNKTKIAQRSPSFMFQRGSAFRKSSVSSAHNNLLRSVEQSSPRELYRLIRDTVHFQNEMQWNASDLKIMGRNMGFPDHLKNLTFAQHQALMELASEEEEKRMTAVFVQVDENVLTHNGQPSNFESQQHLNADLMMQNIYKSEDLLTSVPHRSL